jgi:hypothetical protein
MEHLPSPKLNGNAPAWFIGIRDTQQAQMDLQYLHAPTAGSVDSYNAAAKAWVENQSRLREASPNPEAFKPEPFTRPLPRREVFDWSEEAGGPTVWLMDPDPNIHPPTLPPYVKPVTTPNAGFRSTAGEAQAQQTAKDAAFLALLVQINSKLDQILKR